MAGLLQRLLTRSGILPVLRSQWRADQRAAADKFEKRVDKNIAELKQQLARLSSDLNEGMRQLAPLLESVDRIAKIDREVRMLRTTLSVDIADRQKGPHRPGIFDQERVGSHVAKAIAAASVETDPSVHIVINDLVPADTYEAMLDGMPAPIFFSQRDNIKQNIRLANLDVAPEWALRTLAFIEHSLVPRMMVPALLRKFDTHIRDFYVREYGPERGPVLAAIPHEAAGGRLMLRRRGYHLDPHLDPKRVVFTCLLYFARPGDSESFGTTFFRMHGTPTIDRTNTFYPGSQGIVCEPVKMVPFKANSAVAFVNWGGAHGADIPATAPADTERYSYQFYVSPDPAALAAVLGEAEAAISE